MLQVTEMEKNVYKVRQIVYSFFNTEITDHYYDMDKLLISELPNFSEGMRTRKLTQSQIDWFNKYLKPKASNTIEE